MSVPLQADPGMEKDERVALEQDSPININKETVKKLINEIDKDKEVGKRKQEIETIRINIGEEMTENLVIN